MERNKQIGIIGHFAEGKNYLDGQTIKTRILCEELEAVTSWRIRKADTYYRKHNPIKLMWQTIKTLFSTKDIVVLLSGNGMRFCFPILSFMARVFGTRVYHDVIGGNLSTYVEKYPSFKAYLNSFCVNWVETTQLKEKLEAQGITNAQVLPNFKRLYVVSESELYECSQPPYRFCTFSRVMREKGIEDAIEAVEAINAESGEIRCMLDIYGRIDDGYAERFEELMKSVTPAVRYCGTVPYDKSVETIRQYYALLFPTYWNGEGFAGTIVDAYSAGLPVIATDWNCNGEIVKDHLTGILYPNETEKNLKSAIRWMIEHPAEVMDMKKACIQEAEKYQPDAYVDRIIRCVNGEK